MLLFSVVESLLFLGLAGGFFFQSLLDLNEKTVMASENTVFFDLLVSLFPTSNPKRKTFLWWQAVLSLFSSASSRLGIRDVLEMKVYDFWLSVNSDSDHVFIILFSLILFLSFFFGDLHTQTHTCEFVCVCAQIYKWRMQFTHKGRITWWPTH